MISWFTSLSFASFFWGRFSSLYADLTSDGRKNNLARPCNAQGKRSRCKVAASRLLLICAFRDEDGGDANFMLIVWMRAGV